MHSASRASFSHLGYYSLTMARTTSATPDLLIAGAGLAGLYAALAAAEPRCARAAGDEGLAAARPTPSSPRAASPPPSAGDDPRAARGRHDRASATASAIPRPCAVLADEGPDRIARSRVAGRRVRPAPDGRYALGQEGGHRRRRILHAGGSATGAAIAEALIAAGRRAPAIDGPRAHGGARPDRRRRAAARAPGCCGHDELRPPPRRHDPACDRRRRRAVRAHHQPARARSATASRSPTGPAPRVRDMEFVQFHPTALAVG